MNLLNRRQFVTATGASAVLAVTTPLVAAEVNSSKNSSDGNYYCRNGSVASTLWVFIKDGKIVGYGADILAEVVKHLGVQLKQLDLPLPRPSAWIAGWEV